jgi:hypothetical protein
VARPDASGYPSAVRFALAFASLLVIPTCQCQKTATSETGSGSGSQAAKPKPGKPSTLDIKLPALSGKPPAKTTGPVTRAQLDKLVTMQFEEFELESTPYPMSAQLRQRVKEPRRPRMSVNIFIHPCDEKVVCRPMTLDAWRADEAKIKKELFDAELHDKPSSKFELGPSTLGGVPTIYAYQAGQYFGKDENNNPIGSYSHTYTLFFNDGHNAIRVNATFSDNPRASLDDMVKALPRPFLEKVATSFLDAYVQAWAG